MLYAKLIEGRVAKVTTLKRSMFGVRGSHEMSLEELKAHNVYEAEEEHIPFNPATHREHIEWIFDAELEKVIGKKTIFKKDTATKLTKLQFRKLFTTIEKVALYTKAETDPILKMFLDDVQAAEFIDLTDSSTIEGVQYLVQAEVITQERYDEIMPQEEV